MSTRTFISTAAFAVIASLAGTGSALAQEATSDAWMNAASVKSRAQVALELQQARADGSIKAGSVAYMAPFISLKSRAEVRAEVLAAVRSGELARIDAEAYAFGPRQTPAPNRLRVAASGR